MKVILVGYSKTGTKTMAAAFTMLGLNTYDSMENYYYAYKGWDKIFTGEATVNEIQDTFAGVDALTDTPVFHYWEKLHEAFPEAKIILTLRDEDAWYKSFINQMKMLNESYASWFLITFSTATWARFNYQRSLNTLIGHFVLFPRPIITPINEKILREHYRYHNANVLKKAPKDKLLVYKVSEGWEPLCEFLGVEIPDKPFPHKNIRGNIIQDMIKNNQVVAELFKQSLLPLTVFTGVVSYLGYKIFTSALWVDFCHIIFTAIPGLEN